MVDQGVSPEPESDFSPRKIKIASVILLGQTFGSSLVPFYALAYVLPYMTKEFGWSRTEFQGASTGRVGFTVWRSPADPGRSRRHRPGWSEGSGCCRRAPGWVARPAMRRRSRRAAP